jgi:hypothetical protein
MSSTPSFGLFKCGVDAVDHAQRGNYGKALETAALGVVSDMATGCLGNALDAVGMVKDWCDMVEFVPLIHIGLGDMLDLNSPHAHLLQLLEEML